MRDGHDGDDGVFGIPPATVIPTGEHPVNARCRRGLCSPFSARKATLAVRKIRGFF